MFTDSPLPMLDAEADHRRHAVIEQVIADLKDGPLAHLPSGNFIANSAWLVLAVIAFNLLRAAGALASTVSRHGHHQHAPDPADQHSGTDRHAPHDESDSDYPPTGPGNTPGRHCSPTRSPHPQPADRRPPPQGPTGDQPGKAGQTGSPPTPARQPTEREINHTAITGTAVHPGLMGHVNPPTVSGRSGRALKRLPGLPDRGVVRDFSSLMPQRFALEAGESTMLLARGQRPGGSSSAGRPR